MLGIEKTRDNKLKLVILAIVCIASESITLLSLGYFSANWYRRLLFSSWFDNE